MSSSKNVSAMKLLNSVDNVSRLTQRHVITL